jgi:hypothetical protein
MRVYLHYDDRFTWIYAGEGREAVADVARAFARAHAGRYPAAGLPSATLELRRSDTGEVLPRAAALSACVPDGADVAVVRLAKAAEPAPSEAPARAAARTPTAASPQSAAAAAAAAGAALPAAALEPLLQRAAVLRAAKQLRDANEIYEQARACVSEVRALAHGANTGWMRVFLALLPRARTSRLPGAARRRRQEPRRAGVLPGPRQARARVRLPARRARTTAHVFLTTTGAADTFVPLHAATRPPSSATTAPPRCCAAAWTRSPRTCACWLALETR